MKNTTKLVNIIVMIGLFITACGGEQCGHQWQWKVTTIHTDQIHGLETATCLLCGITSGLPREVKTSVYTTGYTYSGACYWIDDKKTDFDLSPNSRAYAMTVFGDNIYTVGYYMVSRQVACYWRNGVKIDLYDGTGASSARAITVLDGNIYIVGYYNDGTKNIACYWRNGIKTDLYDGIGASSARAITVSGGSVYIAGVYNHDDPSMNIAIACYWKDGIKINLCDGTGFSVPESITLSGGNVYISGVYSDGNINIACYWKNEVRTDLFIGNNSRAYDIAVIVK